MLVIISLVSGNNFRANATITSTYEVKNPNICINICPELGYLNIKENKYTNPNIANP